MASISICQGHSKSADEIRGMVEELAARLDSQYQLASQWRGDHCVEFRRSGIKGELSFDEREVRIELQLGMMVSAFKGKIRAELERSLREKLA